MVKITREEMIDELTTKAVDDMEDKVLYDVLRDGCPGYENCDNDELVQEYRDHINDVEIEVVD